MAAAAEREQNAFCDARCECGNSDQISPRENKISGKKAKTATKKRQVYLKHNFFERVRSSRTRFQFAFDILERGIAFFCAFWYNVLELIYVSGRESYEEKI